MDMEWNGMGWINSISPLAIECVCVYFRDIASNVLHIHGRINRTIIITGRIFRIRSFYPSLISSSLYTAERTVFKWDDISCTDPYKMDIEVFRNFLYW